VTRVLVTDAGRPSGLAVLRSLGRRGISVVAADASRRSRAFVSRYADERVVYPAPERDAAAAVEAIACAAERHRVDLVLPVGEDVVVLLAAARDRFAQIAPIALPEQEALATTRDKLRTVELARRLGVPTPQTRLVETAAEALEAVESFSWPVVLKPQASRRLDPGRNVERFGVAYAADREQLAARLHRFDGRCAVLLQEYWPGEGHGVGLLLRRGETLLAFQHRRLREVPYTGGPSSFREGVPLDPDLLDYSQRILGALDWTGPAMVEFKIGHRGPTLMEINGRLWGSLALAVKSGVDLPARMVDVFLHPEAPTVRDLDYKAGVRSRDLGLELSWIGSVLRGAPRYAFLDVPSRRDGVEALARLFDPRDGYDVMAARDPLPGLAELLGLVIGIPLKLVHSERRRRTRT
jgi:predicted ATP-grasp superfamily ATP-dependent carboligase